MFYQISKIRIFDCEIDNVTMVEAVDRIKSLVRKKEASLVVTPNTHHLYLLNKDPEFRRSYRSSCLILPDSQAILWAAWLLKSPLKERVAGSDLMPAMFKNTTESEFTSFFLGGGPGVASKAAANLRREYPGADIVGTYSPPMGFEKTEEENNHIIRMIRECRPDILFVGLGAPKQEKWADMVKNRLEVPVIICVGAAFDFISGKKKRAPTWMQRAGLEWFHRLCRDPLRLWKRYLFANTFFIKLLLREMFKKNQ